MPAAPKPPISRWLALVNGRIILPDRLVAGQALLVEGSRLAGLAHPASLPSDCERIDVAGRFIAPGLIDIHTHGALGRSFNEADLEAWRTVVEEQARHGVTSLLATPAGAPLPNLLACLETARQWLSQARPGAQVLGVHLEGPYFSPAFRGAQDLASLRTPDDGSPDALLAYRDVLRLISFAPELPGALDLTRRLVELGVIAAAGHSAARDHQVYAAVAAGLRHTIHLWNAQSTTVREGPYRRPGLLEASLACDELTGEIIADGKHLPPTLMRLAYRCKGPDRLCVVSDAIAGAGLPEGARFDLAGNSYEVHDGVGMLPDRSAFAGSVTFLNQMVRILIEDVGIPVAEAVRMASLTPARIIGVAERKGSLEAGKVADVVVFEEDWTPWHVMMGGLWSDSEYLSPAVS
ncbi:MAG: N-acetylglucosamine-6-phosphate deacetylase [Anaerolineae bacterium]